MNRPIAAPMKPFSIRPLDILATRVIAIRPSAKYSHGPILTANLEITGHAIIAIRMDGTVPMKFATVPADNALVTSPFFVMAYPS